MFCTKCKLLPPLKYKEVKYKDHRNRNYTQVIMKDKTVLNFETDDHIIEYERTLNSNPYNTYTSIKDTEKFKLFEKNNKVEIIVNFKEIVRRTNNHNLHNNDITFSSFVDNDKSETLIRKNEIQTIKFSKTSLEEVECIRFELEERK